MNELSHEAMAAAHLKRRIESVAQRLHDLADEVERSARDMDRRPASYANVAHDVQHAVLWALANLSLDGLTTTAAAADHGRREDEKRKAATDA